MKYTPDIIRDLIANRETETVELKQTTGQLDRGMETLCAFLNGEGGTVLFGVTDSGQITGQEVTDATKRAIAEATGRIEPRPDLTIEYVEIPGSDRKVIAVHADDHSVLRPFAYKGRPYMRVESTTAVMPQEIQYRLLMRRDSARHRWELMPNLDLTLDDIDTNELLKTVRLGIEYGRLPESTGSDIPTIMEKLRLMSGGVLNNAAAVLYAKEDMAEYSQCLLRLARFKGTDKVMFMDSQRIQGNLFVQLDAAMAFIFKHLSLSGVIEGLEREEHLTIPYKAIREGVINALCHRSYREAGGSVGIAIYDDRVEIDNPGYLPTGWDVDKLKSDHSSEPQNPVIANVLYRRKLLESWGRGVNLMMEECRNADVPEPEYSISGNSVVTIFRYPTSTPQVPDKYPTSREQVGNKQGTSREQVDKNRTSTGQVQDKYRTSTGQVKDIVKVLGDNTCSVRILMDLMRLSGRDNFIKIYLNPAIAAGYVEPIYPNSPRHPRQAYRLTAKGKELYNEINDKEQI